jgi:phosphatidylserine synthase
MVMAGEFSSWWMGLVCCANLVVLLVSRLGGFNTLMYYSSTLFSMVGFDKPVAVSIVVGGTNFLFGFVNSAVIDRFGRVILIVTVLGMVSSIAMCSYEHILNILFFFSPSRW